MAGLDVVAAKAAAIIDAPMHTLELLSGFPSIEHLTFPLFAIAGSAEKSTEEAHSFLCFFFIYLFGLKITPLIWIQVGLKSYQEQMRMELPRRACEQDLR